MPNPAIRRHRTYAQGGGGLSDADAYAAKVLTYSPILYYKLNEESGTTVINYGSLGTSANGTHNDTGISGATTNPDGSTPAPDYVVADADATQISSSALEAAVTGNANTISFWYRFDGSWGNATNYSMHRFQLNASNVWNIRKLGANTLQALVTISGVSKDLRFNVSAAGIDDALWHHLALVLDSSGNATQLVVDGVIRATGTHGGWTTGSIANAAIGAASADGSVQPWDGGITEFAIFDSVLNTSDIVELANYGAAYSSSSLYSNSLDAYSLLARFPMNEISGTTITEVVNGWNGSYSNVTLNQTDGPPGIGGRAGLWVPASSSYANVYTASLSSGFDGTHGTALAWVKGSGPGWLNNTVASGFFRIDSDASNFLTLQHLASALVVRGRYRMAAGTFSSDETLASEPSDWELWALVYSDSNNDAEFRIVRNGVELYSQVVTGAWTRTSLSSTGVVVGAIDNSGTSPLDGYAMEFCILNDALTNAQLLDMYNVGMGL